MTRKEQGASDFERQASEGTEPIARNLEAVPEDRVAERRLDPAEGPERISLHAKEIRRALLEQADSDDQARRVNELIEALDSETFDAITLPARILEGIKATSPLGRPLELPRQPATPCSPEGQPSCPNSVGCTAYYFALQMKRRTCIQDPCRH